MENEPDTNKKIIEQFYSSFARRDYAGMHACYSVDVAFSNPVFKLNGKAPKAMWHMLCESGKDLTITFNNIETRGSTGKAHWEATYTFSATGRKVINIIDAEFQFSEGKIIQHLDRFNFWRWAHQALGTTGTMLAWAPFVQKRVQATANKNLGKFISRHPEYQDD